MLNGMTNVWVRWALTYLHVFRVVVVGVCLLLAILGWYEHIQWLFAFGLCVAIGEMVESTYYILVINWGQRTGRVTRS